MFLKKTAAALFLGLMAATSIASATVIGFDDIKYVNGDPAEVADDYAGLKWDNFWSSRATYSAQLSGGLTSGDNVGFMISAGSVTSFSSDSPFKLNSVSIAKMYYDGLTHFDGYVGNTLTYSKDVFSIHGAANLATFDWTGLSRVDISVRDGSERSVFDDLTINEGTSAAVPEPTSISLLLGGLGLVGLMGKRKKKA